MCWCSVDVRDRRFRNGDNIAYLVSTLRTAVDRLFPSRRDLVGPHRRKNAVDFEKFLVSSLFDYLAILENKNPVVAWIRVKEVKEKITYKSAFAIVYNKRVKSDAVL